MSGTVAVALAWLEFRRVATWRALAAGPLLALVIAGNPAGRSEGGAARVIDAARGVDEAPADASRAAWIVAALVIGAAVAARASALGREWRTRDSLWLGASAANRTGAALSWLAGAVAGAAVLGAFTAALLAWASEPPATLLERRVDAGPERSIRVLPGARVVHTLEAPADLAGRVLRVRAAPTVGGAAPTSRLVLRADEASADATVTRRTAVELALPDGAPRFSVENVGEGAVALLGPAPFEVWAPTRAWLGGHMRLAARIVRVAATLAALGLLAGAWLRPGIAAMLALAGLVGLQGVAGGFVFPILGPKGPLALGLDALADGRVPSAVSPLQWLGTAALLVAAAALTAPSLSAQRAGGTAR